MRTHYDVLGVSPATTESELRQKYRDCAREAHPDLQGGKEFTDGEAFDTHQRMAEINEAYRVLCDPELRAVYDRSLDQVKDGDEHPIIESSPKPKPHLLRGLLFLCLIGLVWVILSNNQTPKNRHFREDLKTAQHFFKPTVDQALKGNLPSLQEGLQSPEGFLLKKALTPELSPQNCLEAFPAQLQPK